MGGIRNTRRFVETAAYLSLRQLRARAAVVLRRRWWRITGARLHSPENVEFRSDAVAAWSQRTKEIVGLPEHRASAEHATGAANAVAAGRFSFIGEVICFPDEIRWHAPEASHLWRYHLHYFGWVPDLVLRDARCGDGLGYCVFRAQVRSWNAGNAVLRGDGWHPYTLSLRTVSWMKGYLAWSAELANDGVFRTELLGSLHAQLTRLEQQIEIDVRGNHLMENARSLFWAGIYLRGADAQRWREKAAGILAVEIPEQILSDGAHFERTPGYHTTMLALLCEIAVLRLRNNEGVPSELLSAIHRMARFLQAIMGPNGRVPLVKDTAYDAVTPPHEILHIAARLTGDAGLAPAGAPGLLAALTLDGLTVPASSRPVPSRVPDPRESGFFAVHGARGDYLLVDCGRPCPDYLPAHAHADSLSYEFHLGTVPLAVDSGVFEYTRGQWRDFFRSTRAHNTVEVNGQNSSDVWSSFRVGQRARVKVMNSGATGTEAFLIAEHDGYRHLSQRVCHSRCFIWRDEAFLVVVDLVRGAGIVDLANNVHLHPEVTVQEGSPIQLQCSNRTSAFFAGINSTQPERVRGRLTPTLQGWYSERFGERQANDVLVIRATAALPHLFGYIISTTRDCEVSASLGKEEITIQVRTGDRNSVYVWSLSSGTLSS